MNRVIQRTWSKSLISNHNEVLDIWDTGSHIFERWPDGTETYWKVISREETKSGFREVLEKMPPWQMPGHVLRREQIPLLRESTSRFQLGTWSVEERVDNPSNTVTDVKHESYPNSQKQKEYNTAYKKPYNQGNRHSLVKERAKIIANTEKI